MPLPGTTETKSAFADVPTDNDLGVIEDGGVAHPKGLEPLAF
jgi:hypothetical protein